MATERDVQRMSSVLPCRVWLRQPTHLRVLMVDLTEAGLLQQDYEEPVGKDRVGQQHGQRWVLRMSIKAQELG